MPRVYMKQDFVGDSQILDTHAQTYRAILLFLSELGAPRFVYFWYNTGCHLSLQRGKLPPFSQTSCKNEYMST